MEYIFALFLCSLVLCISHYIATMFLSSKRTLHSYFDVKTRQRSIVECLMRRNATVCCDNCSDIIGKEHKLLEMPTQTRVCPSPGVIISGSHIPLAKMIDFDCFCNQCHE